MSHTNDFEQEKLKAKPTSETLERRLDELGIVYDAIPWQRSGIYAAVQSGGIRFGELFDLEEKDSDTLLDEVRRAWARGLARKALSIEQGNGHFIHTTSVLLMSTENWLAEVHFDHDEQKYALIGEWIVPDTATPLGWKRDYRVYQVKANRQCDVLGCGNTWYHREFTSDTYCVHLCTRHQNENADVIYMKMKSIVSETEERKPLHRV